MNRYEQQLASYATQVNDALRERLHFDRELRQIVVVDAMRHSLLDAGKRLRAAMVLEFGRLTHASREGAMALACAIEMIHAYSLIHDDLPCMDDDDFRRGKPSCHKAFGEANALLAGDGLLTLAFETAADAPLSDAQRVEAVRTLAKAAGVCGMLGGQVIDLGCEGKPVDLETLNTLYALKTGALLRASARLGCLAGNAGEELLETADRYARACGLAFQITDDILDVAGDAEKLGKPTGSDEENHKTTYVTLLGLSGARERARELIGEAGECVAAIPGNEFLLWVAEMILGRDH
ncbi:MULTISPECIES: polyprenyl synthetase family protein [Anaerotruncus]|uniref:Farnesyl diphosphate synthase n=2 Tax=Anaerotruncus TaxID=244127 RepID=A0A498CQY0_9FIRM|nr:MULTISPECIES: farnesyl diphosphate synthase [Anaerotruncus]MBC3937446.1 polyprenyl synthetase family protein [Anaerotruncus massiliensis (ex Togo et al. 2019)]RLL14566.1 geranyl transferase [Anaerotruncus massiliensis (ex Liu et al. 2021)]